MSFGDLLINVLYTVALACVPLVVGFVKSYLDTVSDQKLRDGLNAAWKLAADAAASWVKQRQDAQGAKGAPHAVDWSDAIDYLRQSFPDAWERVEQPIETWIEDVKAAYGRLFPVVSE